MANEEEVDKYAYTMYQDGKVYEGKGLLTAIERRVFEVLQKYLNTDYVVYPQGNLQSFIRTPENYRRNDELFRNVDFVIYRKEDLFPVIGIEVNGPKHETNEYVKRRDGSVAKILECINVEFEFIKNSEVDEEIEQREKNVLKLLRSKSKLLKKILK